MPAETRPALVQRIELIAPEVYALDLGPLEPPVSWLPGQWASLHLPVGPHPPLVRPYSLAAPPDGTGVLPLVFDHVPGGLGSGYLAGLTAGDAVEVADVVGKFVLPDPLPPAILFVARYTGVVPVRAMLLALSTLQNPPDVRLVFGARRRADLILHAEFERLQGFAPWFSYHPTVLAPDPAWDGPVGEEMDLVRSLPGLAPGTLPMLSGVRAFTQPARAYFVEERGYERRGVKVENYD